jgi:hypothetical protein
VALTPLGSVAVPPFRPTTFDHGDVHLATGRIFAVIDTATMTHRQQIVTETGAHTIAFDVARQQLAVFLPDSCRVALHRETGARRP